MKSLLAKEQT